MVDYKTGSIDAEAKSYYYGLKLQMQLYMSAVKGDKTPTGVLYFPASVSFSATAEGKFRMQGFLNGDADAIKSGDTTISGKEKSEHFNAALEGNRSGNVMPGEVFENFLDYALYVSKDAERELREQGNISPSPICSSTHDACKWCKFGGMCGFSKEKIAKRSMPAVNSKQIAEIAKKRKEEEEK